MCEVMEEYVKEYAKEYAKEEAIKSAVITCKDCGNTIEKSIGIIMNRFGFSYDVAAQKVNQYWNA